MPRQKKKQSENYYKAFPSVLRRLMKDCNITQQVLADYLKKSRQAIACYCDGSSSPDWETLVSIARFFSVSTAYLVGETSTKSPNTDIQEICNFTGLSETAIMNLHNESKDQSAIFALDKVLSNDYRDLHRLILQVNKAISTSKNRTLDSIIHLADYIPDDRKEEFLSYLEELSGELINSHEAITYHASQASHIFQRIVENACYNRVYMTLDDV